MVLTRSAAKKYYDHFGKKQDSQGFYEDVALETLIAHANFEQAAKLFELGCGTGRFAHLLLTEHLSATAVYYGTDLSETMVGLAKERLVPFAARASVTLSDGSLQFPLPDHSVDRVVSNYVLDLLSEQDIEQVFSESRRILTPGGKLCLVSLTRGTTIGSRIVSSLWSTLFRMKASLVGGCRPIRLEEFLADDYWSLEFHDLVSRFGIPSEVVVASPR